MVDKKSKHLQIDPILLSKLSGEFSRKKCNFIINKWQMYFQALEYSKKNFMDFIASFSLTIILYSSTQKKISKYIESFYF